MSAPCEKETNSSITKPKPKRKPKSKKPKESEFLKKSKLRINEMLKVIDKLPDYSDEDSDWSDVEFPAELAEKLDLQERIIEGGVPVTEYSSFDHRRSADYSEYLHVGPGDQGDLAGSSALSSEHLALDSNLSYSYINYHEMLKKKQTGVNPPFMRFSYFDDEGASSEKVLEEGSDGKAGGSSRS